MQMDDFDVADDGGTWFSSLGAVTNIHYAETRIRHNFRAADPDQNTRGRQLVRPVPVLHAGGDVLPR